MKHLRNLRKAIVGDSYATAIKYIKADKNGKGPTYNFGESQGKIHSMSQSEEDDSLLDIYAKIEGEIVYWKSIRIAKIIDFENDVNFE